MDNQQPAPTRASKRIKLARAAQEKLQPRSNEALAALDKPLFVRSIVSGLPSRDGGKFFPTAAAGEEGATTTRRGGTSVTQEVR